MNNLVIICAILLLVLLFLKVPVYIAVLSASAVYFIGTPGMNLSIFAQKTISGAEGLSPGNPLFVCAGIFMNYTGVTKRIMNCCEVLTARMRRTGAGQHPALHSHGRLVRIQPGRRGHAV